MSPVLQYSTMVRTCLACGLVIPVVEYQARSADEAQRRIERCTSCPIDAERIRYPHIVSGSHIHLPCYPRQRRPVPRIVVMGSRTTYWLSCSLESPLYHEKRELLPARCTVAVGDDDKTYKIYSTGPWSHTAVSSISVEHVGPATRLMTMAQLYHTREQGAGHEDFRYRLYDEDDRRLYVVFRRTKWFILVPVVSNDETTLARYLRRIYTTHVSFETLNEYVPRALLSAASTLTARAHDTESVRDSDYLFAPKPDGERMWLTRIGMVWLYSRRLLGHTVVGFEVDSRPLDCAEYGPIIDVEIMLGYPQILIEILVDEQGVLSPLSRTVQWIEELFSRMSATRFPFLRRLHVRSFQNTVDATKESLSNVPYPTDGVVAVARDGVDMAKLKITKSVELIVAENSILRTSDGSALFGLPPHHSFPEGSIVEVRFSIVNSSLNIHEVFLRSDKRTANSHEAVRSIIDSSFPRLAGDATRILVWRWSNEIRDLLYGRCTDMDSEKRIVLDIGTGDGQSMDHSVYSKNLSYILVEPDRTKCIRLRHRLRTREFNSDPRSLLRVISSLRSGRLKYFILNCRVQSLMEELTVMTNLLPQLRCAVACFSLQYVANDIQPILKAGVSVFGCAYLYDGIPVGGSIVDLYGLSMTRTDRTEALVKWGSDKAYVEPALECAYLPPTMHVMHATDAVPAPTSDTNGTLKPLFDALYIITA